MLVLTGSWVECITLSIVEQSKLFYSLQEDVSFALIWEVVLLQLFPQLLVIHHGKHKTWETLKARR